MTGGGVRQMPVKTTFAMWAVMSKTCPSVAKRLIVHRKPYKLFWLQTFSQIFIPSTTVTRNLLYKWLKEKTRSLHMCLGGTGYREAIK